MDISAPRYFDYLVKYGDVLQTRLKMPNLVTRINSWRKNGMDDLEGVGSGCRNVVENILNSLIFGYTPPTPMTIEEKINYAKLHNKISDSFAKKFHEIRRIGNRSAHASIDYINAEKSMVLLDEILRKYIYETNIDRAVIYTIAIQDDAIFTVLTPRETDELSRKARTAAILSGDSALEKDAKQVKAAIEQQTQKTIEATIFMQSIDEQIRMKTAEYVIDEQQAAEAYERLNEISQAEYSAFKRVNDSSQKVKSRVDEVLSEHDFVKKLLKGDNEATSAQMEVLAFPRTSNTTTNILQIAGPAGTGKTLCLLAKLIREIEDNIKENLQQSLFGQTNKKALFVCFNKQLAGYVKHLAKNYPKVQDRIEVVHYDQYVNQLVRFATSKSFSHLSTFANDVRYPKSYGASGLSYDRSYTKTAMENISKKYPELKRAYYLDYLTPENVNWVDAEIHWLESRYTGVSEASTHYLTATRTGRGTLRLPNEEIRKIILQIWDEYCRLLKESNHYNIEQATKRLMGSNNLPSYDVIAVDEVQDFTLLSIQLLLKFRASSKTPVYISGDEGQKIFQRDFTWKELDTDVKGYTITLHENMRNIYSIQAFADRLTGEMTPYMDASANVMIDEGSDSKILMLAQKHPDETTVIIGDDGWHGKLRKANIHTKNPKSTNTLGMSVDTKIGLITEPGVYVISDFKIKGLEFDNVIIADIGDAGRDFELEKNLRYVHFSRARKRLYIFYNEAPPKLLLEYYPDFIKEA